MISLRGPLTIKIWSFQTFSQKAKDAAEKANKDKESWEIGVEEEDMEEEQQMERDVAKRDGQKGEDEMVIFRLLLNDPLILVHRR